MRRIGVFVHPWHTFGREILRGLSHFASQHPDWEWYLPWPGRREWATLPELPLDGVIMRVGTNFDPTLEFAAHLPRVVISGQADPGVNLCWNNLEIGRLAATHLAEQGHYRQVFVMSEGVLYQRERSKGFQSVAQDRAADVRIVSLDITHSQVVEAFVAELPSPCGVVGANDEVARAILIAAVRLNRSVPRDIAVLGIGDDEEFCELNTPTMSSVSLPGVKLGFESAVLLDKVLNGMHHRNGAITFSPDFVTARQSTDLLAVEDPVILDTLTYIRDRAAQGIGVSEVLAMAPLSRRALELRFRRAVGRSIDQELRRVRIQKAQRLLHTTDMSMSEVASRSGFPSAQRLTAVFTRIVGESPTSYRARLRGQLGI